jgi:uncharacterized protein (TIGR00375 family)
MNWRLSQLDNITLLSNSDPHSLHRLGREANVFDIEPGKLSYNEIARIIKERDTKSFLYTIEYFPQEGRYYNDGDRDHHISLSPSESKKLNQRCPECGRELTIGVLSRVEALADRPEGYNPTNRVPGKHLIPLEEIIANSFGLKSVASKKVVSLYERMVEGFQGGELGLLVDADLNTIASRSNPRIAEAVRRVRNGELTIRPGYDGEYGVIEIFSPEERELAKPHANQTSLF